MVGIITMTTISALYCGSIKFLKPEGEKTGIYKDPVESAQIDENGIIGDIQADKRFHGGPEKALHQYSIYSYQQITQQFDELEGIAVAGSIGENISSADLDDTNVYIGDIYKIGEVVVQVSQPRTPCWKINSRFDNSKLAKFIAQQQITGWYYRVVENGLMKVGDEIELLERQNETASIKTFTQITLQHRPSLEELNLLINISGLNLEWKARLENRRDYQRNNTTS